MLRDAGNRYIRSVLSTLSMHSGWRDCTSLLGHATYASYATTFAQNAARKGQIRIRGDIKKNVSQDFRPCTEVVSGSTCMQDAGWISVCQSHYIRCHPARPTRGASSPLTCTFLFSPQKAASCTVCMYATCTILLGPEVGEAPRVQNCG